jgi:predicted Zn-dependent peptidase
MVIIPLHTMINPIYHTLPNGIRLIHQQIPGMVSHCGLFINTGSRDEEPDEHGAAHFIEHMLFKGTQRRKAYHILSRLEDVGGELNAYTTKEETVIHASFLSPDYERAIELIADIAFSSVFPEKEIKREKEVITEEINSCLDNPAELIFDEFEELVFKDQAIGRSILGTSESVKNITRTKLLSFIKRNYKTDKMVFCSVGNTDTKKIIRLFTKYFGQVEENSSGLNAKHKISYNPVSITRKMDTFQSHCITGNIAYDLKDSRRMAMFMLNNILGGQGLNSRLNLSLREKNGLAYNVESIYNPYGDTGIFCIYFGTDRQNMSKSLSIASSEMDKLMKNSLGTLQLSKAKAQVKGYLARGYENHESLMLSLGKSLLVFGVIDSIEKICRKIDDVTSSEILEAANEVFDKKMLSTLIFE